MEPAYTWDAEKLKDVMTKKEKERFLDLLLEHGLIRPEIASPLYYTALCNWTRNWLARRGYQARVAGELWQTRLVIDGSKTGQARLCCDCDCPLAFSDPVPVCMRCLQPVKMDCALWVGDPHSEYLGAGRILCARCPDPKWGEQAAPYGLHYRTILTPPSRPQRGH